MYPFSVYVYKMVFPRLFPKLRRLIRREGILSSSMVEVRFALISMIEGVACTLDGVTKYSDNSGLCYFYGISQGPHTYSIVVPEGMIFVSGYDVFMRPLYESGTTTIEWAPVPGVDWPEDQAWVMQFTLDEVVVECPVWMQKSWETATKRDLKRIKEYLLKLAERKGCTLT